MTIRDLIEAGKISMDTVVIGELPMTADGCVIGVACTVWHEDANWETMRRPQFCEREVRRGPVQGSRCYSTREAAERAAGGKACH